MPAGEAGGRDVIDVITIEPTHEPSKRLPSRDTWTAIKRGLRGRCPSCGRGRILHGYSKVVEACPACGEEMHHHRADDLPPYITIFAVGHILGALMLVADDIWPNLPIPTHFMIWPTLCVVLSLLLLPVFKGGLVAYQWALRMHGFETAHRSAPRLPQEPGSSREQATARDATSRDIMAPNAGPVIRRSAA